MRFIPLSLALAVALPATTALAQDSMTNMQSGLTMLEESAAKAFAENNISADPRTLTISQLAEIHGILVESTSMGVDEKDKLEAVINNR